MKVPHVVWSASALFITGAFGYTVWTVWGNHPDDLAVRVLAAATSLLLGYVLQRVGFWRHFARFGIEYAVVAAIIGIMTAVLFPVMTHCSDGVRLKRYRTLSNLKQSGSAMLQYTQDYDEKMPPRLEAGLVQGYLSPYLQSGHLLREAETGRAFTWRGELRGIRLDRVRNPRDVVIAYAPFADTTGKRPHRAVLFLDGQVKNLPEAEFAAALAVKPRYPRMMRCGTP